MSNPVRHFELPPDQQAIRDRCFHPTGTFVEFPKEEVEQSIPERFEKIVQRYPGRLAVKTRTEILTYAQLNNTANWLAQRILTVRGRGAEPIGVLVSKKTALVCAILAILKAGKFVVLLDPAFPKARTSDMLEDSQARLVIADRENLALGTELLGPTGEIMNLELGAPDIPAEEIRVSINSKDFAFIFYTSGSTGRSEGRYSNSS
jgi:non-ribosomal peptide synthetase component F